LRALLSTHSRPASRCSTSFGVRAIAYIITPIDLIPDFIPFIGEVDDVYLLVIALQRLDPERGASRLLDHWNGDAEDLGDLNPGRAGGSRVLSSAAHLDAACASSGGDGGRQSGH
jgi:uncharacterized membrane protein YkvA (DUF1232 family)